MYVKDLKSLNRELKNLIIIDNNPSSFALNTENGIPIESWYDDLNDRELQNLEPILEFLSSVSDVRDYIKQIVNGSQISYINFQKLRFTTKFAEQNQKIELQELGMTSEVAKSTKNQKNRRINSTSGN